MAGLSGTVTPFPLHHDRGAGVLNLSQWCCDLVYGVVTPLRIGPAKVWSSCGLGAPEPMGLLLVLAKGGVLNSGGYETIFWSPTSISAGQVTVFSESMC